MARTSAGVLLYRIAPGDIVEVLIVHPGGPFWAKKDLGVWSVPKGEYEEGEDPAVAADREFAEELGSPPPAGPRLDLGELTQRGGKHVHVSRSRATSTSRPPRATRSRWSGLRARSASSAFPEIDRAAWVTVAGARRWMLQSQAAFLDRLLASLERSGRAGWSRARGRPDQLGDRGHGRSSARPVPIACSATRGTGDPPHGRAVPS